MFSRDVLDALYPEGLPWEPAIDDDYDLLLEGIAENTEAVREDLELLGELRNPAKTPILSDLEKEFAVTPASTATEAERRIRLASKMFARNTLPTYDVLENKLQTAGFDCYVYPNDPAVDPAIFLEQAFQMTCGDILPSGNDAQCGEPDAFCAKIGGELLVNGEQYEQQPNFTVLCDEALAQCGEADALAGNFDSIRLIPVEYPLPEDSGYWPLIFWVGGESGINPKWGTGANNTVWVIGLQTDGKIIAGGYFTTFNNINRNRIARINTDGSLDTDFNPGGGANNAVNCMIIQADGKIVIGGVFTTYDGFARSKIVRLDTDGSLDDTFDPGTGANNDIYAMALQSDGKIIIGGAFTSYNGTARNRIARINTDGSIDAGFNPGSGVNNDVFAIQIQTDGKIVIGGTFTLYNGTGRNRIVRANTDGSIDAGFNPGTGADSGVLSLQIQTDGKIIAGGYFGNYNGTARNRIARINTDGSLDGTFDSSTGANGTIWSCTLQTDGKIIIGGTFSTYDGTARVRVARVDTDGSLDDTFDSGNGANYTIITTIVQIDDKILIGGYFTFYDTILRYFIARLNADGSIDDEFNYDYSISSASIPIERRQEFRRIILRYKPLFSWAGLIVVYN